MVLLTQTGKQPRGARRRHPNPNPNPNGGGGGLQGPNDVTVRPVAGQHKARMIRQDEVALNDVKHS